MQRVVSVVIAASLLCASAASAFAPLSSYSTATATATATSNSNARPFTVASAPLHAIAALAKKAKQADLKQYVAGGIDDAVMAVYKTIKAALALQDGTTIDLLSQQTPGPLQESLTKRKGTITVIAEYKRTNSEADATGYINEIFAPDLLSPVFREAGASAMAVMADKRMGGCSYEDLALVIEEQRRAGNQVPGPIAIINNDLIIDELQVARSAAMGCAAFVLQFDMVGADDCVMLLQAAQAVGIEAIVAVSNAQDAQQAIDSGARLLCVIHVEGVANKVAVVQDLVVPEGQQVCKIANILARNNKQLAEIEEAWSLRDQGFQAVWVGEALYKSGADFTEHPGAIIKAMKSKSSTKWASAKALSGRGEGAREYLGDILM